MNDSGQQIRVWDLPTRLFHWSLVVCVVGAFISVKAGTLWMDWHVRFGLAVLALIAFRLIWGFIGPYHARFHNFLRGPAAIKRYLGNLSTPVLGHNPLGGWSVMAMLALFGFQAVSGLFTSDDILTSGPLAHLDSGWSATLTNLHKATEWWMIGLVALHVATVLSYQWIGHKNLIGPMVTGDVQAPPACSGPGSRDTWASRLSALILFALIVGAVWWLSTLGSGADVAADFM